MCGVQLACIRTCIYLQCDLNTVSFGTFVLSTIFALEGLTQRKTAGFFFFLFTKVLHPWRPSLSVWHILLHDLLSVSLYMCTLPIQNNKSTKKGHALYIIGSPSTLTKARHTLCDSFTRCEDIQPYSRELQV